MFWCFIARNGSLSTNLSLLSFAKSWRPSLGISERIHVPPGFFRVHCQYAICWEFAAWIGYLLGILRNFVIIIDTCIHCWIATQMPGKPKEVKKPVRIMKNSDLGNFYQQKFNQLVCLHALSTPGKRRSKQYPTVFVFRVFTIFSG